MPPSNPAPLAANDINHTPKHEYSADLKHRILGQYEAGVSHATIARNLNVSRTGVSGLIKRAKERGTVSNKPHTGRKPSISDEIRQAIVNNARDQPRATYTQLAEAANVGFHRNTIRRILRENGLGFAPNRGRRPSARPARLPPRVPVMRKVVQPGMGAEGQVGDGAARVAEAAVMTTATMPMPMPTATGTMPMPTETGTMPMPTETGTMPMPMPMQTTTTMMADPNPTNRNAIDDRV